MTPFNDVLIVAICGGTGSGKTTLSKLFQNHLGGPDHCGLIFQDSYYHDQSHNFTQDGDINFDHPQSLDFETLSQHLQSLKRNEAVKIPIYDYATHKRLETYEFQNPKPVIVVDGILILSQPELRKHFNISLYLDLPEELRFDRRQKRDITERGRTPEGVLTQYNKHVKPMHDDFVEPSKHFADFIARSSEQAWDYLLKKI